MNQTELVDRLLAMTQEIAQAASLADWPEAARLTEARSPPLTSLVAEQEPAALEKIRQIQTMDAALLSDAEMAWEELSSERDTSDRTPSVFCAVRIRTVTFCAA